MIFKYGSYSHAVNEIALVETKTPIKGEDGYRTGTRKRFSLQGTIFADTPAAITTAVNALEAAYAVDGQDAVLYLDDGTTPTHNSIISDDTTSGVMVMEGPNYPESGLGSAEYTTFRQFTVVLEAETVSVAGSASEELLSWVETISITGTGGPDHEVLPVIEGVWPIQQTHTHTPVRATQRGTATGRTAYPTPPGPIWPAFLKPQESTPLFGDRDLPKRSGPINQPTYTDWVVRWNYSFLSNAPLGTPNPTQGGV